MQFCTDRIREVPLVLLVLVLGCGESNVYQEPPPPTVKVASPVVQDVTTYLEETATTEAVAKVEVRARVRGFLERVAFDPGNDVTEGDLLYQIESEIYQAQVDSAEADLLAQEARRKKAEVDKNRQERIRAQDAGATSEAAVVTAVADFEAAQAGVKQAGAQLKQAKINLGYTQVRAPISGRVGKTLVKEGNLVNGAPESTLLTTVINYDPIYANFTISENSLLELRRRSKDGKTGKTDPKMIPIFLRRQNDQGYPFEGHFDYADLAVDQSTGTFLIRGIFDNPEGRILPGLFVNVRLPIAVQKNALLIPEFAIGADQAGRYALVVNAENEVERRNIVVGTKLGELIVVEQGLKPTDLVVIEGLQRARPGATVNPKNVDLRTRLSSDELETEAVKQGNNAPPEAESVDAQPDAASGSEVGAEEISSPETPDSQLAPNQP